MSIDWDHLSPAQREAVLNKPLMAVPPGYQSQIGQPRHLSATAIALGTTSLFLITVTFGLRMYSRVFCTKKLRIEDLFGFIAFAASIVHTYTFIQMDIYPGSRVHTWDLRVRDLEPYWKNFILLRTVYCINLAFCKNAILLEWIHIFVPLSQRNIFFWLCATLIAANTVLYIAAIIANYIAVLPMESLWKPWMAGTQFINREAADTSVVSFNLLCDILILVLPQRVIWNLHLHQQRKLGLSFLFSLGLITCIFAGGRVYSTARLSWNFDAIHDVPGVVLWGIGESTFAMLVFCIPAIPKIFSGKESGFLSRLKKSLRSWTSIITGSSRIGSQGGSTGQNTWPAANQNNVYRKMGDADSEIALTGLATSEDNPITSDGMKVTHSNGIKIQPCA